MRRPRRRVARDRRRGGRAARRPRRRRHGGGGAIPASPATTTVAPRRSRSARPCVEGAPDWAALVAAADLMVPSPGVHPDHPALLAARARGCRCAATSTSGSKRRTVPGRRGHRHEREEHRHDARHRDARALGPPRARGRQHRPRRARRARPSRSTSSWSRSRRSSCTRSRPRSRPRSRCCSTSPTTISTGTARSTRTSPTRRTSSRTSDPTTCSSRTSTTRSSCAARVTRAGPGGRVHARRAGRAGRAGWRGDLLVADDGTELVTVDRSAGCPTTAPTSPRPPPRRARSARDRTRSSAAVGDFVRLHHRMEPVGKASGVEYFDDSKATNPHATAAAVRGLPVGRPARGRPEQGRRPRGADHGP